ncbi:molybdopterin-dependent oxidoreductase [Nocardioides sp. MJB4]|uniref:Molybdopterin-dependent oxidoreductase n=2 Tax=Nocardioides donggukensis TaxID=2774019 RepID=A0A927K3Z7_9ACTN|nr:molybdopterin-dependent oxidoreductase [Nocardioides donggukensis]
MDTAPRGAPRGAWEIAGLLAGLAGLAVSHAATLVLTSRATPPVAVAELFVQYVPGVVAETAIDVLGRADKPVLVVGVLLVVGGLLVYAGRLAARAWWKPLVVYAVLGGIGTVAMLTRYDARPVDVLPVIAGVVTWMVALSFLTDPLRVEAASGIPESGHTRRGFLLRGGVVGAIAIGLGVFGEQFGRQRRRVEQTRALLNLPLTRPRPPDDVRVDVDGVGPWQTPNAAFYQIHTAIVVPTIAPQDWRLRIHGMVEREITLTYQDLLDRELAEDWITLNCVSNQVGGPLIGNAWWSGVRIDTLLAEAGPAPGADAVKQTSQDGWTCGTPLGALTDPERNAMLAIGMNGRPLPITHGFPVRMIVPGLYGYVSATKWLVDLEVTRFADFEAYWTGKGWGERGPVKIGSRIEVPRNGGDLPTGAARVGGVAWAQHTGIAGVEVALDGGGWRAAEIAGAPNDDTWVQWAATLDLDEGDHELRVRAIGKDGETQTGVERDVLPDGATGWHGISFSAS